jgi:hypothetical protein
MHWIGFSGGGASASLMSVAVGLALVSPAAGTLDWSTRLGVGATFGTGGIVRDLATHGNFTFAATDTELGVYSHNDPKNPVRIGGLPIPAQAVAYHAGSNWVALGDASSVHLVDVTNPASPTVLDTQPVTGGASHLQFSDDGLILVGSSGNSVFRFDVGPSSLSNQQTINLSGNITDLDVQANIAAVGTMQGLTLIDSGTLTLLDDVVVGQVDNLTFVDVNFLIGAGPSGGFSLYDASNSNQVSFVQSFFQNTFFNDVDMAQDNVFVAFNVGAGIGDVYDVTDPLTPILLGSTRFPSSTEQVDASADGRVVAGAGQGIVSIDATIPDGVTPLGSVGTGAPPASAVFDAANQLLHVATNGNIVITFSTANPTNLQTVGTLALGTFPFGVAKVGNILYVRTSGGLNAYDATNPAIPIFVRTFTGLTGDIDVDGNRLLRARTDIPVVEVLHGADNPLTATSQIISVTGFAQAVDLSGTQLLAAVGPSGVRRVDFTSGVTITTYPYSFMGDVDYTGDALVSSTDYATWTNGLRSYYYDLDDDAEVGWTDWHALMSEFNVAGDPGVLRSAGGTPVYLYGTSPQGSIFVLDATDPTNVSFVGEYTAPGFAPQFTVPADEVVYVGDSSAGGRIVILPAHAASSVTGAPDVARPAGPESLLGAAWPNPFAASTQVPFAVPRASAVNLSVHDVAGRLVRQLASGTFSAGEHLVAWDGQDGSGRPAAAGVYFVRLAAGEETATRRIVRLR